MEIILLLSIVASVIAMVVPVIQLAVRVYRDPIELRLVKNVARKLRETSRPTYAHSTLIDETVLALNESIYPRLRLTGRFLQTWVLQLTQESMASKHLLVADPMANLYSALQSGDQSLLNTACGNLIDQVVPSVPVACTDDWRPMLIGTLRAISESVSEGNRSKWRDETMIIKNSIMSYPIEVKPSIYLLLGYLMSPLEHTEVCIDRNEMNKNTKALSDLVNSFAKEFEQDTIMSTNLLNLVLE